ncbi:MAG: amino acid carrier protein [Phycisphaerales bacterium]
MQAISDLLGSFEDVIGVVNGILFHDFVVYILLATGILFTFWSVFGQYRAITHGTAVVRGKYDDKDDPGAINHFQALSAALSATVGLGNIGGVAAAVALGGPGAVMWMWIIGVIGMALKMTEVTQSMLYRNTDDPDNPHGGPMFVVRDGFKRWGLGPIGVIVGGLFCITLLVSAVTGGNMFQSWNVAEVTTQYTPIPRIVVGIILAVLVGLVIIGGIKRIGSVAGRIVPLMCAIYLLAGLVVLAMNVVDLPGLLALIVRSGLGLEEASATRAFGGAAFGVAVSYGIQRALFSSEAGQGSAPIAHSAAKTDEPVREGVVAGLEPLIDTIVVCTITALVILSTGAWNRGSEATIPLADLQTTELQALMYRDGGAEVAVEGFVIADDGQAVTFAVAGAGDTDDPIIEVATADVVSMAVQPGEWMVATTDLPARDDDARRISGDWSLGGRVMVLATVGEGDAAQRLEIRGIIREDSGGRIITWTPAEADLKPTLDKDEQGNTPLYGYYVGAGLTAHAFDRAIPGLGKWLIVLASWLFAVSTMISWSYYGEQGVYFLFGKAAPKAVMPYKIIYCILIVLSTLPFIQTEDQLNLWTTLGLGLMLWVNIPIMLIFGPQAMKAYHGYMGKLKRGEFDEEAHEPASIKDVVEGKDVQ